MASGQVNRIKRPNTWLQRPMLQNREKSSCQTGAVHTWHIASFRCDVELVAIGGIADSCNRTSGRSMGSRPSGGDNVESDRRKAAPYLPTVTPAVERKASLRLVAFMSSSTSRVRTVVCPGMSAIGSVARGDERRLAL